MGAGSEVSQTAQLQKTVVGDHCTIHDEVKATSSFIMNNVCIKVGDINMVEGFENIFIFAIQFTLLCSRYFQ